VFFINLLHPQFGIVNNLLNAMGLSTINPLGNRDAFVPLVIFIAGWKGTGWNSIIFYASISSIDKSFYEAARIDGANRVQQIWFLTLPLIMGTIALMFVISITYLMNVGFEQMQMMLEIAPHRDVGEVLETFIWRQISLDNNFPLSTAIGIFNGVIALFLMIGGNTLVKKTMKRSIW